MGWKTDALLRRNFRTSKFKNLVNVAISRLAVLKNQRQVRFTQNRSDTCQLLNLGHQDRALLRVEQIIKEQNMLDVFVMLEGYCHVLIERAVLIEKNKTCPDELDEAASGLIYAASRCGEFPELQQIREVFVSRFGKEYAARATELRNNCGVNPKIIQKLSTRPPSFETRMKVLQEIARENGITLHIEEGSTSTTQEKQELKQNQPEVNVSGNLNEVKFEDENDSVMEEIDRDEQSSVSGSVKTRKRYSNVASAAQAAFESAADAAAAARAVMELSRSGSQDSYYDALSSSTLNSPTPRRGNRDENDASSNSRLRNMGRSGDFEEVEDSNRGIAHGKSHSIDNSGPENDGFSNSRLRKMGRSQDSGAGEKADRRGTVRDQIDSVDNSDSESEFENYGSSNSRRRKMDESEDFGEVEDTIEGTVYDKIYPMDNSASESEDDEELPQTRENHTKDFNKSNKFDRSESSSSLDTIEAAQDTKMSSNVLRQKKASEDISFDSSDDESKHEQGTINEFPKIRIMDSTEKSTIMRRNMRPMSMRTRRGNGRT